MIYIPYENDVIRNLIYHIYPKAGRGVWQWNVTQLLRRIKQFNGQRIVSVVTDETTDSLDTVKKFFCNEIKDFYHYKNDPSLGEVTTFETMLDRVHNIDPRQITFYAHAKGVKYPVGTKHMTHRWAEVMYSNLLDYPTLIDDSLLSHPFIGTFLKSGNTFGTLPPSWHYAGTFYWFRNKSVFSHAHWRHIPKQWWGTEAWPGLLYPKTEIDCLLTEGFAPEMQLYKKEYWIKEINHCWHQWQVNHSHVRANSSYQEILNTLKQLKTKKIIITGPQRTGTTIASKILANDLKLKWITEKDFGTHDFNKFTSLLQKESNFVIQAPTMSAYVHLLPYTVIWMRRNLQDVYRSQKRIDWNKHEQLEKDRYFDFSHRPSAVIKIEAWEKFQRIALGERAFDLEYESLSSHPLWVDAEGRYNFTERQTEVLNGKKKPNKKIY